VTCDGKTDKKDQTPELTPTKPDLFLQTSDRRIPPALLQLHTKQKEVSPLRCLTMDDVKESTLAELLLTRESV